MSDLYHHKIDATGLRCPLPILKAKSALASMNVNEILYIVATDPAAHKDFEAMLKHVPHQLVNVLENDGVFEFWIKKGTM